MTQNNQVVLGLDIGEKRIGVAIADTVGRLASPLVTLLADGTEVVRLQAIMLEHQVAQLVVGLPRNMSGEETKQSQAIRQYTTRQLSAFGLPLAFQDESITSVAAEQHLASRKKPYTKSDIDSHAAAIILQDYLEQHHG